MITKQLAYAFFLTHSIQHAKDERPMSLSEFETEVFVNKDEELRAAILEEKASLEVLAIETGALIGELEENQYV